MPRDTPAIKGKVLYSSGAPVANAKLDIEWQIGGDWPPPTEWQAKLLPKNAVTNASGGFDLALPKVPEDLQGAACMSDDEIQRLRAIGRKVERHYGRSQDIEWAVERDSQKILLLQSRPETVWSAKESAPVGRAVSDPSSHVLTIFGGRR